MEMPTETPKAGRGAIRHADVRPILSPRSLAIVGASPRSGSAIENDVGFTGRVWGVNPGRSDVLGLPCFPTIADLPEVPETAFMLVGHERIEAAFEDALAAGVRSFIVPGLGSEAGSAGNAVAARIAARADEAGAVMLGHNCMGVAAPGRISSWIGTIPESARAGGVGMVAQSGSVGEAFLALGPRIGFSHVVSTGSEIQAGVADFLAAFAADDEVRVAALFLETVRQPAAFVDALERCAEAGKPVACLKVGRSAVAARAALAHTGAIVGSSATFDALLARHGVLQARDLPELIELLEVLGTPRRPHGVRTVVISESGGEGALFADHAEPAGLRLEPPPAATQELILAEFPRFGATVANPLDAWAIDAPELVFARCLELLAASGEYDVLVAQIDLSRFRGESEQVWNRDVVEALVATASRYELFAAVTTVHTSDPPAWAQELAAETGLPLLRGVGAATSAIARAATWAPTRMPTPDIGPVIEIGYLISGTGALPEYESSLLLELYGVAFPPRRRATTPADAGLAAADIGTTVVVKVDGPAHKEREGGVVLGLATPEAATTAARELGGRVLVAEQVPAGLEAFCGMTRDPDFGPVIAVGLGGSKIEELAHVAVTLAPLDDAAARALLARAGLGEQADALVGAVLAVSRAASEHSEISEIDVNPIIVSANGAIAVDALVVIERS